MENKNEIVTTNEITKPEFKGEIKAEIKGLAKIEDNIKEVKKFAEDLNKYYATVVWTGDTLNDAKNEKANVNKFKDKVAEFRKNIIAEYNKPIALFETTAKDTEAILKETYETINIQVKKYEDDTKKQIKKQCIEYFNECIASEKIDFVTFDNMNMNITLGMQTKGGELTKKTKDEINAFVEKIVSDIELINEEELKTEILVEYKKTLNASASILEVKRRAKAIEDEKQRQIELAKQREIQQQTIAKVDAVVEQPEQPTIINAPIEEKPEEKIYNVSFKVYGTLDQLKELKQYLVNGGYKYEQQ